MKQNYQLTMTACFAGYVVQAIVNNFAPLLFLTFQRSFGIPLEQITMLVTINFGIQLLVDLLSAAFVDRIGYKKAVILAQIFAAAGLVLLALLPGIMSPFPGILTSVMIYAVGGGLCEVVLSPIVEACPTDNKEKAMSLLHSFYCWGHVGVVLLSTAFFAAFGIENWRILAAAWAVIPAVNALLFVKAPVPSLIQEGETGMSFRELFTSRIFWVLMLLMAAAGASEQGVSQWASTFAEQGLGVSKTMGDLAGPMFFAVMMGLSRLFYGKYGDRIRLDRFMIGSSVLCAASYLCVALAPVPVLGLVGCGFCGLSVGIMWPGGFSKGAAALPRGGTAMFALFALAGDLGCAGGPTAVGMVSGVLGGNLKLGILSGVVFPLLVIAGVLLCAGLTRKGS